MARLQGALVPICARKTPCPPCWALAAQGPSAAPPPGQTELLPVCLGERVGPGCGAASQETGLGPSCRSLLSPG